MEPNPIRYNSPVLDTNGQVQDFREIEAYPEPLTDHIIASMIPSERERIIRAQFAYQSEYVASFVRVKENTEITSATFHLAQLVLDQEARSFHTNYLRARYGEAKEIYEDEKKTLKGKRKWNRVEQWQGEKDTWEQIINDAEILEGTVADIVIKDFFLTAGGIELLEIAIEDIKESAPGSTTRVINLLNTTTESLLGKNSKREVSEFKYKPEDNRILVEQTSNLLQTIVERATEEGPISEICHALLEYYWNNASEILDNEKDFPLIILTYDLLYAASKAINPHIYGKSIKWLNKKIGQSHSYANQLTRFAGIYFQDLVNSTESLGKIPYFDVEESGKFTLKTTSAEGASTLFMKIALKLSFPQTLEIYEGLFVTHRLFQKTQNGKSFFFETADLSEQVKILHKVEENKILAFMRLTSLLLYTRDSLASNLLPFQPEDLLKTYLLKPNEFKSTLEDFDDSEIFNTSLSREELITEIEMLKLLPTSNESSDVREILQHHQELIWNYIRIRDNYKYFVALNGDQFIAQYDDELKASNLKSITFYSIHSHPKNHKVVIRTSNSEAVTLFISQEGKFLHPSGNQTRLPLYVVNRISNIVFRRLEYITSGEAFRGQDENGELLERETKQERLVLARRSHWRKLPGNRYTLQSKGAQEHIQEVFEDYGINTWEEILRRRSKGTLSQNEVMTYVKTVMKPGAEPNLIKYNPKVASSDSNL